MQIFPNVYNKDNPKGDCVGGITLVALPSWLSLHGAIPLYAK